MLKEQKGITLVALVITIIILIILAGITLAMVLGENGLIARARQGASQLGVVRDAATVALAEVTIDYYKDPVGTTLSTTYHDALAKQLNGGSLTGDFAVAAGVVDDDEITYVVTFGSETFDVVFNSATLSVNVPDPATT